MSIDRRAVIGASLALPFAPAFAATGRAFTPEQFGAKGDGRTNDSAALARLAAAVNAAGGGTVRFRRRTYLVGAQGPKGDHFYLYSPDDLLTFSGCTAPLHLQGNGAKLLCAPGLRYGVSGDDGKPVHHPMPYIGPGLATPYVAMIQVANCTGPVRVSDFDLDGGGDTLAIGGQYGDTGWQIPATGLILRNNRGDEIVERVRSHDHLEDGMMIDGLDADTPGAVRTLSDIVADRNGRQGCSLVGGRGYAFARCRFTRTGRGKVSSKPGGGVDIEAEAGKRIRDLSFADCVFADNDGCGLVADTGPSSDARFTRCTFVGTTNWSAWPCKPGFRFDHCAFTGPIVRAYGSPDPALAAQFVDCTFDDDPAKSPTGQVYGGTNRDRPIADLSDAENVLFDRCAFTTLHGSVAPWSTAAIYRDCTIVQGIQTVGYPRGRFEGTNRIDGNVDIMKSRISGTLILNGQPVGTAGASNARIIPLVLDFQVAPTRG